MNLEEALKVIDDLVYTQSGRHLNQAERSIIEAAWEDKDYKEIAETLPYTVNHLQRYVGPKLWALLTGALGNGEKVTKKGLRAILEQRTTEVGSHFLLNGSDISKSQTYNASPRVIGVQARDLSSFNARVTQTKESKTSKPISYVIGGQPPDVSCFYGRGPELAMLRELVLEERCVALIGVAGIGKTALAAKLIEFFRANPELGFDCFIWKSIHYNPSLDNLLTDLLKLLALPSVPELDLLETTQTKISVLIEFLQAHRCLLVLDAAEAVLPRGRNTVLNLYGEYAEYGVFFRRIVEEQHQSCLILTSREPFPDITELQLKGQQARSVKIEGLRKEALQILRAKGLYDEEEWGNLIHTYRGNPLALQMVANRIQEFFGGSVGEFLKYETTLMSDPFQATLDEQFKPNGRLTNLERQIMVYLAEELAKEKETDSITFTKLLNDIKTQKTTVVSTSKLIEALKALGERSLIEKSKSADGKMFFTLQPVIKKYILTDPSGLVCMSFQTVQSA